MKYKVKTNKLIVVKWVPEATFGYRKAMYVIESNHERFTVGSRFDFGFMSVATDEGFTVVSLPMEDEPVTLEPPSLKLVVAHQSHLLRMGH